MLQKKILENAALRVRWAAKTRLLEEIMLMMLML